MIVHAGREGWGIVVIEATAMGTRAIGYDVLGLSDSIRNGKSGFLVNQRNIEALADAIMEILEGTELREKLSRGALEWSRKFSWDKSAEESLKVLEKVVEAKAH